MDDIRTLLSDEMLAKLRAAYEPGALVAANATATTRMYPAIEPWCAGIVSTFFTDSGPLAPRQREQCLIALLAYTGPEVSLGVHVYWGLMEGLSLDEICQVIALTGCYGGLPKGYRGLQVVARVTRALQRVATTSARGPASVLEALMQELGTRNET